MPVVAVIPKSHIHIGNQEFALIPRISSPTCDKKKFLMIKKTYYFSLAVSSRVSNDDDAKQLRSLTSFSMGLTDNQHPHVTFRPPLSPLIVLRHILTNETISQELGPTPVINSPSPLMQSAVRGSNITPPAC